MVCAEISVAACNRILRIEVSRQIFYRDRCFVCGVQCAFHGCGHVLGALRDFEIGPNRLDRTIVQVIGDGVDGLTLQSTVKTEAQLRTAPDLHNMTETVDIAVRGMQCDSGSLFLNILCKAIPSHLHLQFIVGVMSVRGQADGHAVCLFGRCGCLAEGERAVRHGQLLVGCRRFLGGEHIVCVIRSAEQGLLALVSRGILFTVQRNGDFQLIRIRDSRIATQCGEVGYMHRIGDAGNI